MTDVSTFQDKDHAQVMRHVADVIEQEFPTSSVRDVSMQHVHIRTERIIRRIRAMADLAERRDG